MITNTTENDVPLVVFFKKIKKRARKNQKWKLRKSENDVH